MRLLNDCLSSLALVFLLSITLVLFNALIKERESHFVSRYIYQNDFNLNALLTLKPALMQYSASIVISTYNRLRCLQRVVDRIYENMPPNTELVIADDHSIGEEYDMYYKQLRSKKNIAVYTNNQSKGAFHTKLLGFKNARGKYVMSCDDDDLPDPLYYKEMFESLDDDYDIIATEIGIYFKYNRSSISLGKLIAGFHNHVNMAIKKSLYMSIPYPDNIRIIRDDAPIVIPMYISTSLDKIKFYRNRYSYNIDNICKRLHGSVHQSSQYFKQQEVRNGYHFLMELSANLNKTHYQEFIQKAYRGFINGKLT